MVAPLSDLAAERRLGGRQSELLCVLVVHPHDARMEVDRDCAFAQAVEPLEQRLHGEPADVVGAVEKTLSSLGLLPPACYSAA
jgi:hypothetical protein